MQICQLPDEGHMFLEDKGSLHCMVSGLWYPEFLAISFDWSCDMTGSFFFIGWLQGCMVACQELVAWPS